MSKCFPSFQRGKEPINLTKRWGKNIRTSYQFVNLWAIWEQYKWLARGRMELSWKNFCQINHLFSLIRSLILQIVGMLQLHLWESGISSSKTKLVYLQAPLSILKWGTCHPSCFKIRLHKHTQCYGNSYGKYHQFHNYKCTCHKSSRQLWWKIILISGFSTWGISQIFSQIYTI